MRIVRGIPGIILIAVSWVALPAADLAPAAQPPAKSEQREWVTPAIAAPRVTHHVFRSAAAKADVSYHLYRPGAYDADPTRRFPVVYWLHGSGGGQKGIPSIARLFDAAIAAGKLPPCLVVFVNGLPMGMYVDWADGSAPVESMIIKDLIPQIDATQRTLATREGRLLDGFSMGGYGAARLGFKHPEIFRAVSIVGAGPMQAELDRTPRASPMKAEEVLRRAYGGDQAVFREASPRRLAERNAKVLKEGSLIRMVIGDRDETFANNTEFHRHLESLGIPHGWTVVPGVGHDPDRVFESLGDANWAFYREAFGAPAKEAASPAPRVAQGEIRLAVGSAERRALFSNAPASGRRPAVLVLHGGMGSAELMQSTAGFESLARAEGFIAVYPEGTEFSQGKHAWNTGHLLRRQVRDADDIAFLDALINRLVAEHGADPTRIYMTGGSNGAMMAYVYAVARPRRLAAVAPVVGAMFTHDKIPEVPVPILIINGAKDSEVPLDGGMSDNSLVRGAQSTPYKPAAETVAFWAKANSCVEPPKVTVAGTVTTQVYTPGPGGAPVEFALDAEGGHGWPGRARANRADGAPIQSFKGAERVWQFLRDKSRPETR
jgi:poly(3-hydroxybutyrate) depolymerase